MSQIFATANLGLRMRFQWHFSQLPYKNGHLIRGANETPRGARLH